MFDDLNDWIKLRKLRSDGRRTAKKFRKEYSAKMGENSEAVKSLFDTYGRERLANNLAIEEVKTNRLLALAEKYDVPIPSMMLQGNMNQYWFQSPLDKNIKILNERARANLRSEIRAEQKERWERWYKWVPLITGLLGTVIGLVAILKK